MGTVVLVSHRERAALVAEEAIDWLTARDHKVRIPAEDAAGVGLERWAHPDEGIGDGADLCVSLGGDGTMLRAVDMVCGDGVPVLGVNVGHLGYLTEVEPAELTSSLERFFAGDYGIECRMTLDVELEPSGRHATALNDAVVEKTSAGHTIRLAASIDGRPFITYASDALIIATPTGSTAYNLSARGPIVSPRLRAVIVTPASAHMLFDRSLVLDAAEAVRLEVIDDRPASLVVDGRNFGPLAHGEAITCRAGANDARLVTFGGRDFHRILKRKFGLADR
ncbi:MAG: kinase [Actinomycetota bacterium]|nr:kinase [Actinomycetota bacterium]